ncbi:hypothetical protein F4604DRAFT_1922212 [Suillus subluteus]|nr:hypothetical protein F4604DRAFT_1922212 [Suillus subluteus]
MSDITPSHCMIVPRSQSIPELRYDNAGNAYARDHLGHWRPHPGIAQAVTRVPCSEDCQAYGQHAAAPLIAAEVRFSPVLGANFLNAKPNHRFGSTTWSNPGPNVTERVREVRAYQDPVHIPLPDSPDRDLCDPLMIAESHGYMPAIKAGGACRKTVTKATKGKGKDKENTNMNGGDRPQKHARALKDDAHIAVTYLRIIRVNGHA